MRTLKFALAAFAALAFSTNVRAATGMGNPPTGDYQPTTGTTIPGQVVQAGQPPVTFHGGGVAACDGCHVMHNAQYGVAKSTTGLVNSVQPWTNVTNAFLLQGSDQSSTCLICHGFAGAGSGVQFTIADTNAAGNPGGVPAYSSPGGDFAWVTIDLGLASPAVRHGHNVVAADFTAFTFDPLNHAPGGTFADSATGVKAFSCINCHDPHGRYRWVSDGAGSYQIQGPSAVGGKIAPISGSGSYGAEPTTTVAVGVYRLLGGHGYAPASNGSFPFPNDPPRAVAPQTYNKSEAGGPGNEVRVAYGTGMSEWCQNCHTNVHLDTYVSGVTGMAGLRHPAGSGATLHAAQYEIYNSYVSSGDMSGSNRYTSLVPFEQGAGMTFGQLATNTSNAAVLTAGSGSNVMCLSCHRAHASAFDSMIRWDQNATFLTDSTQTFPAGSSARTNPQTTAGYYGRTPADFGPYQRSLCNKCHGKD